MSQVNQDDYGTARPKVLPEDFEGTYTVLMIASYEEGEVDDPEARSGKRHTGMVTFEETGDKVIYLNKTAVTALCHFYGDESDDWLGQPCPIEEIRGTFEQGGVSTEYHKVRIMPQDKWAEYIDFPDEKPKSQKRRTVKKKKGKNGRRKATKR